MVPSLRTFIVRRFSMFWSRSLHKIKRTVSVGWGNDQKYHDGKSGYDWKNVDQGFPFFFPFAAALGTYVGYAVLDRRKALQTVYCNANVEQEKRKHCSNRLSIQEAVKQSEPLLKRIMLEHSCPGLVVTVTVDGKEVWSEGYGFADVENSVRCTPSTVMRIASISKPLTMAAVAKLWQQNKLDLDRPIQEYVPSWPEKYFKGEKVTITLRHLVSMLGGIRHYDKECKDLESKKLEAKEKKKDKKKKKDKEKDSNDEKEKKKEKDKEDKKDKHKVEKDDKKDKDKDKGDEKNKKDKNKKKEKDEDSKDEKKEKLKEKDKSDKHEKEDKDKSKKEDKEKDKKDKKKDKDKDEKKKKKQDKDTDYKEFYLKRHWPSVTEALGMFKDDDLCCLPGTEYLYSTHNWTLVSAAVESLSGKTFPQVMKDLFQELGMKNTYLDETLPLINNRAKFYILNKKGKLLNAPYVDNSYKWAGGGFLSTTRDLCHFGNTMLYSSQAPSTASTFLRPDVMKMIWSPVSNTKCGWDSVGFYGMGWGVIPPAEHPKFTREQRQYFSHTGGAVGASSVLLILPRENIDGSKDKGLVHGVVVAIIVNMQSVGMNKVALDIAKLFEQVVDS